MNRDEALTEIERLAPNCAELVALVRRLSRGGRPRKSLTGNAQEKAIRDAAVRILDREGPQSRSELYTALRHLGNADALALAMDGAELLGLVEQEQDRAKPGRPVTYYKLGPHDGNK